MDRIHTINKIQTVSNNRFESLIRCNSLLKKAWKAVRIERSEAESKYEWPAINYLARFDFSPVALRSARTENFNKLLMARNLNKKGGLRRLFPVHDRRYSAVSPAAPSSPTSSFSRMRAALPVRCRKW
jgi:hypothetical protein